MELNSTALLLTVATETGQISCSELNLSVKLKCKFKCTINMLTHCLMHLKSAWQMYEFHPNTERLSSCTSKGFLLYGKESRYEIRSSRWIVRAQANTPPELQHCPFPPPAQSRNPDGLVLTKRAFSAMPTELNGNAIYPRKSFTSRIFYYLIKYFILNLLVIK